MASKIVRIGFDFDGVIAYNPIRIFRAPVMVVKRWFEKKQDLDFPVPQNKIFRWAWSLVHETSFFPSYGLDELKKLMKEKRIEAYLVTGRYSFLESSLNRWLHRNGLDGLFKGIYLNKEDKQPHVFKEEMIKKLGLNMFVEDNWDIVEYLNNKFKDAKDIQIHWIYNILDRTKPYKNKFPYLKKFIDILEK